MATQITVNEGGKAGKLSLWLNVILLILLVLSWITRPKPLPPEVVETIRTEVRVDTLWREAKPREPIVIRDTVLVHEPARIDSALISQLPLQTYIRDFEDDAISGRLFTLTRGWMISQRMIYTPRLPREIVITRDSVITTHERIVVERSFLQAGLEVGIVDGRLQVNPMVGYTHKTGHTAFYRYTPWMNGHTIGVLTPIRIPWLNP